MSIILTICLMFSCVSIGAISTQAAVVEDNASVSASTDAQESIDGSAILHCFNWSYNTIKANLSDIKAAGYTAVQTSPVQAAKDYSASWTDQQGQWWKLYQPLGLTISNNTWLGTKAELKSLCDAAEDMGIKVIVDIVANHVAGEGAGYGNVNSGVDSSLKNSAYYHDYYEYANDGSRYAMTMGHIGMPDLNTANSNIQNMVKSLLIDCINQGVDGFRFDAAKHIELPTDTDGNSSQFWPTVINGSQASTDQEIFYYGEILGGCATDIKNYTKYINITDVYTGDRALVAANNGNASGLANSSYSTGAAAKNVVLWAESHDTYMGSSGTAGIPTTSVVSSNTVTKTWAIVGARADSTSLFFARPAATMGAASTDTTWKSTAVAEVNKFKNYFDGQTEYLSSSGSIAYIERGTSGVVLTNVSGSSADVNVKANKMADGTYTDQITGNTFTVSNGKISGKIGSTGVAVVYNNKTTPTATVTPGSKNYSTDTLTLTLGYSNATSGQYSIDGGSYTSYTNGKTITIGSGLAYGTKTTVSVMATDGTTTSDAVTYTYTKTDPTLTQKIYFDNSSYNWSSVYAYIYDEASDTEATAWPGVKLTLDSSTGYYVTEVPDGFEDGMVIFTESSTATNNRYPADMEPGLELEGETKLFKSGNKWVSYSSVQTTTAATTATQATTQATTQVTTTVPSNRVLIGDTNLNGSITVSDATEVQLHSVNMKTLTGDCLTAADTDKNGSVNVKDATAIQCYIAGLESSSAYCGTYIGGTENPTTQPTTVAPTTVQPTTSVVSGNYIYYKNTSGWSKVNAYYWSTSNTTMVSWPGVAMTGIGDDTYRIEVPADAEYIIFNDGSSQTDDLTIPGMNKIYNNGNWSDYGDVTPTTPNPTTPVSGSTIYFNVGHWIEANAWFSVYAWDNNGGETFVKMTEVSSGVYSADLGGNYTNVIFCRNNPDNTDVDWSSVWNKTADLEVQSGCNYFTINSGEWSGASGTWSTY